MRMLAHEERLVGARVLAIVVTMQIFMRRRRGVRQPPLLGELHTDPITAAPRAAFACDHIERMALRGRWVRLLSNARASVAPMIAITATTPPAEVDRSVR